MKVTKPPAHIALVASLVGLALVALACGPAPDRTVSADRDTGGEVPASGDVGVDNPLGSETSTARDVVDGPVEAEAFNPNPRECSEDPFDAAQFAFVGSVRSVENLLNEEGVFEAEEAGVEVDESVLVWPWVRFEVGAWYSQDWGTEFWVWMPGLEPIEGDVWLVGGDARGVAVAGFSGQSGIADSCLAAPATIDEQYVWETHFGLPDEPQREQTPALAACEHAPPSEAVSSGGAEIGGPSVLEPGDVISYEWTVDENTYVEAPSGTTVQCWDGDQWIEVWVAGNLYGEAGRAPRSTLDLDTPFTAEAHNETSGQVAIPNEALSATYRLSLYLQECKILPETDPRGDDCKPRNALLPFEVVAPPQ